MASSYATPFPYRETLFVFIAFIQRKLRSAGYARPPLGVPADLQSAVKK